MKLNKKYWVIWLIMATIGISRIYRDGLGSFISYMWLGLLVLMVVFIIVERFYFRKKQAE